MNYHFGRRSRSFSRAWRPPLPHPFPPSGSPKSFMRASTRSLRTDAGFSVSSVSLTDSASQLNRETAALSPNLTAVSHSRHHSLCDTMPACQTRIQRCSRRPRCPMEVPPWRTDIPSSAPHCDRMRFCAIDRNLRSKAVDSTSGKFPIRPQHLVWRLMSQSNREPGKVNWTLISVVATMTTAPCLGTSMPSPDLDKLGCRHNARKARLWLGHDAREALRLIRLLIDSVGLAAGFGDALEIGIRQRIDIAVAE